MLLLLFLIGMELSLRAFRRVWRLALGVTVLQITASVGVMLLCSRFLGWTLPMAILLGFVVAMSSTAVAVKILESLGELRTRTGRIAVGVLIAQDLAVVPMMLTVNAMGGDGVDWLVVPKVLFSVAFLVGLILYLSGGRKVELPFARLVAGHADLLPLGALAFCFGLAALSGLLGLSAAYGAFLAGLIIGNSTERQPMLAATQPIQSVLMMVFFLSVGLLIDLDYIWANLGVVMLIFAVIAIFKTAVNVAALGLFGQAWNYAFLAGIMIAQVGEFSFLLAVIAVDAGVITADDSRLIVAVTVMSLALSPIWVVTGRRLQRLANFGITEGRELMKLVYGPEVELVSEVFVDARTGTPRRRRMTAMWLRRQRNRRRREREARAQAAATPEPDTAAPVEAAPAPAGEVLPPESPAPEAETARKSDEDTGPVIDAEPAPAPKSRGKAKSKKPKTAAKKTARKSKAKGSPARRTRTRSKDA